MSNKNYGKFYNENKKNEVDEQEIVETQVEETIKPEVEVLDAVETPVEEVEPIVEVVAEVKGVVTKCGKLNVRKKPNTEAKAVAVIPVGTEVLIDMDASTEGFYKVNVNNLDGFCVKEYIAIK